MKKTIFQLIFLPFQILSLSQLLVAQNPLIKQFDYRYGGVASEILYNIESTSDNGVVLAGWSDSFIGGDKTQNTWGSYDYWVIKIDSGGAKIWDKDFGGTAANHLFDLRQSFDDGYILGGNSNSQIGGDKTQNTWGGINDVDFWIVKIDSLGNKQWDKDFGTTVLDELASISQTADGGYILGGTTAAGISGDKTQNTWGAEDYWIIKIDSLGNKQWDKDFGTANQDYLRCVSQTPDGGYLIGGNTDAGISGDKTQNSKGLTDYWIIKTDSLGNKEWDRGFGGNDQDYFSWLDVTTDGGFIIGGSSYSQISGDKSQNSWGYILNGYTNDGDFWILKLDAAGNKLWDKDLGGDGGDYLSRFSVTADDGYLLSGVSSSDIGGDKTEVNYGSVEMWMLKLNFFGNKQWDKTARTGTCYSYTQTAFAVQTKSGCYVMAENLDFDIGGDKTQNNWGNTSEDFWSIKFCDTTIASPIISVDQTLCEKFCTSFYDQSTNNPIAWQWSFQGGVPSFSTAKNPTNICYYTPGVYDVTLITTNANGNDTVTLTNYITVNATPAIPTITQNDYTLTCSPASQYQWQLNAVNISGATDQSYAVLQSGLYTVIVGDTNECVNASSLYVLIDGIMESNNSEKFFIFPNPSRGIFFIQWQVALSNTPVTIEVVNALGKIIFSKTEIIPSASLTEKIELQNDRPGIYVAEISSVNGVERKMILIE